jgi:hypothetical protein
MPVAEFAFAFAEMLTQELFSLVCMSEPAMDIGQVVRQAEPDRPAYRQHPVNIGNLVCIGRRDAIEALGGAILLCQVRRNDVAGDRHLPVKPRLVARILLLVHAKDFSLKMRARLAAFGEPRVGCGVVFAHTEARLVAVGKLPRGMLRRAEPFGAILPRHSAIYLRSRKSPS